MKREVWAPRLHRAADKLDSRLGPALRGLPVLETAWITCLDAVVASQADRRYMQRSILPALVNLAPARILFVGVRGYTRAYARAFKGLPVEYWTSDIDPRAARYGARDRHVTGDVRSIDGGFPPGWFEAVVLNGVFGWGVDTRVDMEQALAAVTRILSPGGLLLLGWNRGRVDDPDTLAGIGALQPVALSGLPHRKDFADVTHVYAWYRKPVRTDGDPAEGQPAS